MGANAVTTFPTYTTGQVLEAADLNITNCGVPVFAGTSERDAAFGGTGEKTLAEGQLCYLESTNVVQYYDGSSWATVGPQTAGGIVCVVGETAFSAVASVTVDNVFTSTYTNYRIIVQYTNTTNSTVRMVLRASGTSETGSNYNSAYLFQSAATAGGFTDNSVTSWRLGTESNGTFNSYSIAEIYAPQLATPTVADINNGVNISAYTTNRIYKGQLNHTLSTAYDGFEIKVGSGNMTGTYSVYGYAKAV